MSTWDAEQSNHSLSILENLASAAAERKVDVPQRMLEEEIEIGFDLHLAHTISERSPLYITPRKRKKPKKTGAKVFNRSIRSSGYGATHVPRKMHTPITNRTERPKRPRPKPMKRSPVEELGPVTVLREGWELEQNSPINLCRLNPDGKSVACGCMNGSVTVNRFPLRKKQHISYFLKETVQSLSYSLTGDYLAAVCNGQLGIIADGVQRLIYEEDLNRHAMDCGFHFIDKFLVVANGNTLDMRRLMLTKKSDDVNRLKKLSALSTVMSIPHPSAHYVRRLGTINTFMSQYCTMAGSDNSISLVNLDETEIIWHLLNTHKDQVSRCDFCVNMTHLPELKSCVLSMGGGEAKLWDLRTTDCVRSFDVPNARDAVVTPDGEFLATVGIDGVLSYHSLFEGDADPVRVRTGLSQLNSVDFSTHRPICCVGGFDTHCKCVFKS
ncbi:hypothetical protein PCE1_000110 [Barthelona sp. PCE]